MAEYISTHTGKEIDAAVDSVSTKLNSLSIADLYDATKTYSLGSIVVYDNTRYRCKVAITTPEAWTITHWEKEHVQEALNNIYTKRAYIHEQYQASSTWTITHNLGFMPNITVIDSAGDECVGSINYVNTNSLTITFSAPFGGKAYLS